MSVLLDTDLLSLLERKQVPAKLETWLKDNANGISKRPAFRSSTLSPD